MKTCPVLDDQTGKLVAFEVENMYVSPATAVSVLSGVEGVSDLRRRLPFSSGEEIHVRFRFRDVECVVWEPFGDNSRYWIGTDGPEAVDVDQLQQAFDEHRPRLGRRILGDVLTLRFESTRAALRRLSRRWQVWWS